MKFDMSTAWRDAMSMLNANREVLLIVAGIFSFLPTLAASFLVPPMQATMAMDNPASTEAALEQVTQMYANYWWVFLLMTLIQSIGFIAILALLRDSNRPTVSEALQIGLKGFLPYFAAYVLLCIALGLIIGIILTIVALTNVAALIIVATFAALIFAIYAMIKCSLTPAIVAIEKTYNPITILKRSWTVTKGNSLRIFGFFMLIGIVYLIISIIIGMVMQGLGIAIGPNSLAMQIINGLVNGLVGAIATVVFVAILAAIHRQLAGASPDAISEAFK
ncbi:hypothetical protein GRI39_00580 [Altererythrobacter indicus]|uniref:Glycerophosphoryl diester phosphodiesterase membrane domain-containing protein n=1 Tax=Altericroceibacterium indicum TaxID=374177 RepID=A0A845A7K2_9SPHN|nr:hypothetical protein [Altericroceibacterium indicum]MXP24546.1 hypothetical protein [Altericroceibacterium indicum]